MSQTLRSNLSSIRKSGSKLILRRGVLIPLSLVALLGEMNDYLNNAKKDLLQPSTKSVSAILRAASKI